mgnify:CR=1 FL=1
MLQKLAALAVLIPAGLFGQAAAINGQIEGSISDATGAVIPNVKVEVVNDGTGFKQETQTTSSGFFRFALLPLGSYTLTAEAKGFATEKRSEISLSAGSTRTAGNERSGR